MSPKTKTIKLLPHDREILVKLYCKYRLPIEQLEARPAELGAFVREWHRVSKQKHTEGELIHYMRNERKCSRWVKLGRNCQPPPPLPEMSLDEIEALVQIYEENVAILGRGTDAVSYNPEISELLVKSFFEITGRGLPAHQIIQKLTALRKRGLLTRVSDMPQPDSSGYNDAEDLPA